MKIFLALASTLALIACTSMADYQVEKMSQKDQQVHDTTLKLGLKDYSSAQFYGSPRVAANPKGGRIICGVANVKNGLGGYIGYQAYAIQYIPANPNYTPLLYMGAVAQIDCKGAGIDQSVNPVL